MPGIRTISPVGEGWEYSLNLIDWQTSPVFTEEGPGVPLVQGRVYSVYCRNQPLGQVAVDMILFGEGSNDPTLLRLTKLASALEQDAVLSGLIFSASDDTISELCARLSAIGCGGSTAVEIGPFVVVAHEIEVDDVVSPTSPQPTGVYRIINAGGSTALSLSEGGTLQTALQQQYSNGQWQIDTSPRTVSLVNAAPGTSVSSGGLISSLANSIGADAVMAIRYVLSVGGTTVEQPVTVVNGAPAGSAPVINNPITDQNITSSGVTTINLPNNYFTGADSIEVAKVASNGVDTENLPAGVNYDEGNKAITIAASVNTNFVIRITGVNTYGRTPSEKLISFNRPVAPTVISRRIDQSGGTNQVVEGGSAAEFHVTEVMSNGTDRPYTGAGDFSVDTPYPDGLQILSGHGSCNLLLPDETISANVPLALRFTFPAGSGLPQLTRPITAINHNNVPVPFVPPTNFWDSNNFEYNFFDEQGQPAPGYVIDGGTWVWQSGQLCQSASQAGVGNSVILFGEDNYYLNAPDTAARLLVSDATAASLIGIGIQVSALVNTGYALQMRSATEVGLVDINVQYGPAANYSILPGKRYYMRLRYEETGTDTATVKAKVWTDIEAEPTAWLLTWENQPRRSGYPAMLGSSNGSTTVCYDDFYAEHYVTN